MLSLCSRILRLALPSIATFSSMTFTGVITLIMVGRLGATAIAVVGISNILMYNSWAFFAGINEAVNYLVSQNFGEKTMKEGNARTQIAILMSLVVAVLIFVASFLLPHYIFSWMGANDALSQAGAPYLQLRMIAFCFSLFSNVYFAYMRAIGDTKTPMYISLGINTLLIGLTYVLTYGHLGFPNLGLEGAGLSMVCTEALCFLACLGVYYGVYHSRLDTRRWVTMPRNQWKLMIRESAKLSVMEMSMSLGMLVFTACITRLGTVAVAANEIALNILSLGFMPANGFGMAATIMVGQEVGAGKPLEAKRSGLYTVFLGAIFMAMFMVFLWLFAFPVAKWYTSDPAVYTIAVGLIHLAAFIQIFDGGGIIFAGGLRGAGDTTFLFRMSLILNWAVFVPLTIVMTKVLHYGQQGAWIALYTLIVLIGMFNCFRYLKLSWPSLLTKSAQQTQQNGSSNTVPNSTISV